MEESANSQTPVALPLRTFRASQTIVLVRPDLSMISEHNNTPDAVKARLRHAVEFPRGGATIYRCLGGNWVKY